MLGAHTNARYETNIEVLVNRMAYYGLSLCELIDYMAIEIAGYDPQQWSNFRASDSKTIEENVAQAETKIKSK
jgi:hypothetical protein